MVRLVCFLKRKRGLSLDEFYDHWENRHAPLIAGTPELARHIVRYEQLRRTTHADWMGTLDYDGITIQWLESPDSFLAFINEPKYAELVAPDELRFLDTSALVWMVTDAPRTPINGAVS